MVGGSCHPQFDAVRDAFVSSVGTEENAGAAIAVFLDGALVVDLWGGWADAATGAPWQEDTLVLVLSATKGITATCVLLLWEQGYLDIDAPVAKWWPEFGGEGKEQITTRDLLTHSAGLPAFDQRINFEDCHDPDLVAHRLAHQTPRWRIGDGHGYHALTFGWLVGEVVRRATGQTVGQVLADLVRSRHLDSYIGLPRELEARVAPLLAVNSGQLHRAAEPFIQAMFDSTSLTFQVFNNPAGQLNIDRFNAPRLHRAEWPAVNALTTARSLATLYGLVVSGELLSAATLGEATRRHADGVDRVLCNRTSFGLGYSLSANQDEEGLLDATFGHEGAGGSVALADLRQGFGFAYVTNGMTMSLGRDDRSLAMLQEVYASLAIYT